MKESTKNLFGYGALLLGGVALVAAILAGNSNRIATNVDGYSASDLKHSVLVQQLAHQLAKKNDSRSLLFASILIGSGKALMPANQQEANAVLATHWLQSAIDTGQNDALIAWIEATDCFGNKACDAEVALSRLDKLDPENAAVHLLALNHAQLRNDQAKMDAAFLRAVNSRYFNSYYHDYAKAAYLSMTGWQPIKNDIERKDDAKSWGLAQSLSDEDYRKIQSLGITMAFALPSYQGFTEYCDQDKNALDRKEACIKLFEIISQDKTMISKTIALSTLSKITIDHPKGPHFREQLRQYYWAREQLNTLNKQRPEYDSSYIRQWPNLTEWQGLIADMRTAGIPLSAPKNWLPNNPRQRSLVLTGLDPTN